MKNLYLKSVILILALLLVDGCAGRRAKKRAAEEEAAAAVEQVAEGAPGEAVEGEAQLPAGEEAAGEVAPPTVPAEVARQAAPGSSEAYVLNELNFEVKKLGAEVKHLASELRDLQAKSTMWANPLTIYNKEIILDNGSTIFGKIVYQDEKILKVETLIGYLIVERPSVVRIVENVPEEPVEGVADLESVESLAVTPPSPANRVVEPTITTTKPADAALKTAKAAFAPNVVLVGTISESKDRSGNLKLGGEVKNIGGRRADFVKINFVFRKDWSGNTKTLTTFVKGTFNTFESGITSDASLLPGATAPFELYVAKSFGSFIGYSYTIDWEDYQ
ncbi:MAG: hypothetical protein JSW54_12375 [Fidelibacterota bacterium]|nr:MAG: hypothetical protein JSW54_12375 [Candidatus Neomarinimicrobiota bacterium]